VRKKRSAKKESRVHLANEIAMHASMILLRLSPPFCYFLLGQASWKSRGFISLSVSRSLRSTTWDPRSTFVFHPFLWSAANAYMGWLPFFSLHR
jgi:hypothetical protein